MRRNVGAVICRDLDRPGDFVRGQAHDLQRIEFAGDTAAAHDLDERSAPAKVETYCLGDFVRA